MHCVKHFAIIHVQRSIVSQKEIANTLHFASANIKRGCLRSEMSHTMDFSQLTFNLYPLRCHIHTCLFNVDYVLLFSVFVIALFDSAVVLIVYEKRPDPRCKISQILKTYFKSMAFP